MFMGSGYQNESNSHQLTRIGEKKIFHELDVHHVYKDGITCFWAQDAKMSLTAISSLESARRKFFMNSTYIMSTSRNHLFLSSGCQNESNSPQLAPIGEKKFLMNWTYIMSTKWESLVFGLRDAKMSLTAISSLGSARRKFFLNSTYIMSTK